MTWIIVLAAVVGALGTAATTAVAANLAPHRAVYELDLAKVRDSNSGVGGLDGRIVLEATDNCEGITFRQRIRTEMEMLDGAPLVSDIRLSTWETRDGLSYQFVVKQEINERIVDSYRGTATLGGPGKPGEVRYDDPEGRVEPLPPGTMFPMTHTGAIIDAAKAGKRWLAALVFDGAAEDGLSLVNAVIGPKRPAEQGLGGARAVLNGHVSWPMRLAYFNPERDAEMAEFEVGFRLYDNGVADDVELDYGDIVISGTMSALELFPTPAC